MHSNERSLGKICKFILSSRGKIEDRRAAQEGLKGGGHMQEAGLGGVKGRRACECMSVCVRVCACVGGYKTRRCESWAVL